MRKPVTTVDSSIVSGRDYARQTRMTDEYTALIEARTFISVGV